MLSGIFIMEGDTGIARMWCACCGKSFRGVVARVTSADNQPICLACVERANPLRVERGLPPAPLDRSAYLSQT